MDKQPEISMGKEKKGVNSILQLSLYKVQGEGTRDSRRDSTFPQGNITK